MTRRRPKEALATTASGSASTTERRVPNSTSSSSVMNNGDQVARRPGLRSNTRLQDSSNPTTGQPKANGNAGTDRVSRNQSVQQNGRKTSRDEDWPRKEKLVLWRTPLTTLHYFIREILILTHEFYLWVKRNYRYTLLVLALVAVTFGASQINGFHTKYFRIAEKKLLWCGYWMGLGILSSIGLGTGLHTFLLYLGPHIAAVTLASYECSSLNFPEPPYPDEIVCPENGSGITLGHVTVWSILSKVFLEAFMWGGGTALGELPPYFMARTARLSGQAHEDLDLEAEEGVNGLSPKKLADASKQTIKNLVEKLGFFGILACASIPNPLFDLAGITCGHFLIPFWTFFGATLIGKAVIKMLLQVTFVIIAFNEHHLEQFVDIIKSIPYIGNHLNEPFREFLIKQKLALHRHAGTAALKEPSWIAWIFEKFVLLMVAYFVLSIVNSLAQNYLDRLKDQSLKKPRKSKKNSD